uniref:Uncharacterized protein TCIL3000_7_1370 n=1 Tax=Trypanosoma congolense (strain IL3000) TaxID=1068625 RepID=G0UPM0_TRYCI|nr:unnamed protein product [Trypanosoma congolense IL3000]
MVTCYCGVERGEMPCGTEGFSCGRPCGRELKCGAHRCGALCHAGPCPSCEGDPSVVTTCPCGSTPLAVARVRCSDPIPTCGAVCDRWLGCGKHRCEAQCHAGKCQPCNQQQATQCPCGLTKASVPCGTQNEFRCDKVCKTRLSCGKHDCRERCCPSRKNPGDSAHRCRYICNKKLSCGHKCMELCHRGACPVCPRLVAERLECRCGAEVLMPPQACGTKPPPCRKPCNIPQPCGHHTVVHNCHYGDCPPCMFPTERLCAGGHKVVGNVPCSAEVATCNGKCEKSIVCGHKCERPCHPGPCVDEKHPCRQPCGKIHELCGHMCTANCHVSKSCPKCTKKVESRCECGRQTKQISCEKLLSLKRRDPSQTYEVHCDAECLFEQRLNILSARIKPPPPLKYSIFLWEAATANLDQVKKIEKALNDFVESGGGLSCLGAMPAAKRAIVHGLCYYYRITSESVDPEPRRSCVLRRTAETRIPKPLLSVAVTIPEVHSPLCFVERVRQRGEMMSTHVVTVRGEYANPIAVAHVLRDFAGDFIWVEEESDRGAPELLLYFTSHAKQREAHRHLQSVRPSFEFSIGSTPEGSKLKSKTSTSGAFSWARLAGGKK